MLKVSHSSIGMFAECPRKYHYRYHLNRIPARDDTKLALGRVIHEATALRWTGGPEAVRTYLTENAEGIDLVDAAKITAMLEHYAPPFAEYEVVGVEEPFSVTVPGLRGVRFRGFADLLLRELATGRLIVRECKSTSEEILGFGPFWARTAIDHQTAVYKRAFGADGIVYDVLRKPTLRPSAADRKAAGTDEELAVIAAYGGRVAGVIAAEPEVWHQWRPLWKSEADIEEAHTDLRETILGLRWAEGRGAFPKRPGACRGIYGVCGYIDCCSHRADIDDDSLFVDREEK